jgi:hypothetical protein
MRAPPWRRSKLWSSRPDHSPVPRMDRSAAALARAHRNAEADPPAFPLVSHLKSLVAGICGDDSFLTLMRSAAGVGACPFAAVVSTEGRRPLSLSTPRWPTVSRACGYIPKDHWLPFLVWCIFGSRLLLMSPVHAGNDMDMSHGWLGLPEATWGIKAASLIQ